MKTFSRILLLLLVVALALPAYATSPEGGEKDKESLQKTYTNDIWDFISINNILMYMSNNGRMAYNSKSEGSGLEWPQGSAKYVIFTDGIMWGGKVQGEPRTGGATYVPGLQAGTILPDGTADEPSDDRFRLYKAIKMGAEAFSQLPAEDSVRLKKDYEEWPVMDGAPWKDMNNNGVYEPDFTEFLEWGGNTDSLLSDSPFLPGDETIWFVSNDRDPVRTQNLYGTQPIGIELHTLVWAYRQTGPLNNMLFTKYTVINKGTDDLTDAYFSKWSDPDLGDAFDDFVGIDTMLSLGYVYNGLAKDEVYGVPPAAGYDFFQGPIVESPGDSAVYNFGIRQGYKNLPVSTFAYYINGSSIYRDPALHEPRGTTEMYNYMQGLLFNGGRYIDPTTSEIVKVCLAGDPNTGEGWIDGIVNSPGDRRFLMTAGPFTLAVGDTQEVVVATIVGQGADRLTSIKVLKFYDKFAQVAFDTNFDLPKAPPPPIVNVSLQDKRAIMHWGDPKMVAKVESHDDRGFKFQGYNVYQFPTSSSLLSDGIRLATYDITDGITVIFDEVIDEKTGIILSMPTQFGSDIGVIRLYDIDIDRLTDRPLVNNQPYYFAVTSYAYSDDPESNVRQLESSPEIIEIRPQIEDPGWRFGDEADEEIPVDHTSGTSAGFVEVVSVDPLEMTGHTYEVTFTSRGRDTTTYDHYLLGSASDREIMEVDDFAEWTLTDIETGEILVNRDTTFEGLEKDYFILDGFKIGVSGTGFYHQFNKDGYDKGAPLENHDEILRIQWEGGAEPFEGYASTRGEGGYIWQLGYTSASEDSKKERWGSAIKGYEVEKIIEIRFSSEETSFGYCYLYGVAPPYRYDGYYESTIQVWDVSDPNPENHVQLQYAFTEKTNSGGHNQTYAPTASANDKEILYILDVPYSDTPNPEWTVEGFSLREGSPNMPIIYWGWYLVKSNYVGYKQPWNDGSLYRITPKVAFAANDKFVFTTMKSTYDQAVAVKDVDEISVFPNPYYGANAREQNKYQRFVTFNHLPSSAKFKIYTVSGVLVRSFEKEDDGTQYATWDLQNFNGLPVASGLYYVHIEMPDLGVEKILKVAIIAETQFLDRI